MHRRSARGTVQHEWRGICYSCGKFTDATSTRPRHSLAEIDLRVSRRNLERSSMANIRTWPKTRETVRDELYSCVVLLVRDPICTSSIMNNVRCRPYYEPDHVRGVVLYAGHRCDPDSRSRPRRVQADLQERLGGSRD